MRHRSSAASVTLAVAFALGSTGAMVAGEPRIDDGGSAIDLPAPAGSGVSPKVTSDPDSERSLQSFPGANGRFAFARSPYGALPNDIWSTDASGSDLSQLTPDGLGWGDMSPAWSPGGTLIAFERDMTDGQEQIDGDIWVMRSDGSSPTRLTKTSATEMGPAWTPDGSRIIFTSDRSGNGEIYSMRIDGSDVRRLTFNAAHDGYASVSPDGERIAFASDRSGEFDIYVMNIDGSGVLRLTTAAGPDYYPDWSPDGSKIAFTSWRTNDLEVFVMTKDGGSETNVTSDPSLDDFEPSWSPDGTMIAFTSMGFDDGDIWVMSATGALQAPLISTGNDEWGADWQPIPDFPLVDARFSPFESDIEWVFNEGITVGCSAERYCPDDPVTRSQMATFLVRALALPATATDYFSDDTGSVHEANINRVAAAGITSGCAPAKYCPNDVVTRGAMASFLARAFALPSTTTDYFSDDTGTTHEVNINRVAAAGITSGCSPTTYCPAASVTRGQMAAFLRRALQ